MQTKAENRHLWKYNNVSKIYFRVNNSTLEILCDIVLRLLGLKTVFLNVFIGDVYNSFHLWKPTPHRLLYQIFGQ